MASIPSSYIVDGIRSVKKNGKNANQIPILSKKLVSHFRVVHLRLKVWNCSPLFPIETHKKKWNLKIN
jgi:hypothetical protein